MKEAIKSIGTFIIGAAIIIGLIILVVILIEGGIVLAAKIYPFLIKATTIITFLSVFILVPLALFKKTRSYAGIGMYFASYLFGFSLWIYSALIAYVLWGFLALLIGLFIAGIGVLPIAFLAALLNGEWAIIGNLIYMIVLTYGSRVLGMYLIERAEKETWQSAYQISEEKIEKASKEFCANCGSKIRKYAKFCNQCGSKLNNS